MRGARRAHSSARPTSRSSATRAARCGVRTDARLRGGRRGRERRAAPGPATRGRAGRVLARRCGRSRAQMLAMECRSGLRAAPRVVAARLPRAARRRTAAGRRDRWRTRIRRAGDRAGVHGAARMPRSRRRRRSRTFTVSGNLGRSAAGDARRTPVSSGRPRSTGYLRRRPVIIATVFCSRP